MLAAIVVPQLVNSPNKPGGTVAARAAGPPAARLGLSVPPAAVSYGPSGRKGRGVPTGVARHARPNRFAPVATSGAPLVPRRALPRPGRAEPDRAEPDRASPDRARPGRPGADGGGGGDACRERRQPSPGPDRRG